MHYLSVDQFYPKARDLRAVFDRKFAHPLTAHRERFVWDFWHVPGQYTHLRTPAFHYFPKREYEAFHRYLVRWGRENLGCHDISPPWLSCYIEGCGQAVHRDTPHGPLAYVFSLSRGGFTGGETFLRRPSVRIRPKFNRLTLFNPDLPHGVTPVRGTMDPRRGRLVIHGWFVQPRAFWTGPITAEQVADVIGEQLDVTGLEFSYRAFAAFRLRISRSGRVAESRLLFDTALPRDQKAIRRFGINLESLWFPALKSEVVLTLPLTLGSGGRPGRK